ncbi:formyltransferase family protein [Rhodococcus sp. UNC363MFTsu5.1]|uniref:formyltransferase family protein n=1 Tax=Rhodococcus sp. UNC363MFTsu5.1 TaxID=1449069 RepID=UPI000690D7E9|nr:formyltransferase family protein [Rhodococcus sp. UNC363MFTsu5.1]
MILVGSGALLWRAARFASASDFTVDLVCTGPGDAAPAGLEALAHLETTDLDAEVETVADACTDSVVWSINNPMIFGPAFVDSDLRIYNIHNGPLPEFRGLPAAAIVHAILQGRDEYAATLHRVDSGIDTGAVVDVERFAIAPDDRFQDVMMNGLRACHELFERSLHAVMTGPEPSAPPAAVVPGGYYGAASIRELRGHRENANFERATALGVFAPRYPAIAAVAAGGAVPDLEAAGLM